MISCPGCGNGMRFDPKRQKLFCDACTNELEPSQAHLGAQSTLQNNSGYTPDPNQENQTDFLGTLYTCPQCGGEMFTDSDSAVTFCSYCGASVELQGQMVRMQAPSMVIPFKKDKDEVSKLYSNYIKSALYAPSYMKERAQVEKIRGIYMPFWVYEFSYEGPVSFAGTKSYRRGDYIITDHYSLTTNIKTYYNGVSFDASSSFSDVYSESIVPYRINESVSFNSAYLCGFYADTADVYASVYEDKAREAIGRDVTNMLHKELPELSRYGVVASDGAVKNLLVPKTKQIAYYPVYFLANRRNGYVSYAVINGQTGKIAADIPIDFGKYIIGSLILALPIMLLLDFIVSPTPFVLMLLAVIFAAISFGVSNGELNLVYTRDRGLDDRGLLFARGQDVNAAEKQASQNATATNKNVKTAASGISSVGGVLLFIAVALGYAGIEFEEPALFLFAVVSLALGFIFKGIGNAATKKKVANGSTDIVLKRPFSEKAGVLWKPIVAIVIGVITMLVNPFMDIVYYGVAIAIIILVIISFYDVVTLHNQLTRHLPRQFNKRGGDE